MDLLSRKSNSDSALHPLRDAAALGAINRSTCKFYCSIQTQNTLAISLTISILVTFVRDTKNNSVVLIHVAVMALLSAGLPLDSLGVTK
ncbi:unnamed protein product [Arctia plantaginis]|uniref:Uncharacterized protein n=1 Tax=Arctia plantaginis TaxID=874455 RepID=A0A8S1A803_ARCPL|nr:unnamed protein product [Arctia plantaginis]CAB3260594.1 unnamed protein product [Arctia plantaginis]